METEGTPSSAWDQHLALEFAAKSADSALATTKEDVVSHTQNGAEVIFELLRTNGTDCVFASPIATMAPLWEALAARRERGEPEAPRYFHCRHEMLAVAAARPTRWRATARPTSAGLWSGCAAVSHRRRRTARPAGRRISVGAWPRPGRSLTPRRLRSRARCRRPPSSARCIAHKATPFGRPMSTLPLARTHSGDTS